MQIKATRKISNEDYLGELAAIIFLLVNVEDVQSTFQVSLSPSTFNPFRKIVR